MWLLDVDGVINALGTGDSYRKAWPDGEWVSTRLSSEPGSQEYRFCTVKRVAEFICGVHGEGLAEIRWHTTWQNGARRVEGLLGLPEFGIQEAEEYTTGGVRGTWWKLPAARRVLEEENRPLLWTDDDFDVELKVADWHWFTMRGACLLRPESRYGLSPDNLNDIYEWLEGQREQRITE